MECQWIRYFGDYCFTTSCGHNQGINIRPKQKKCMCGKPLVKYVQGADGVICRVTGVTVSRGIAYYSTDS